MQLLEQMDYNGAIESFEAAIVYNEDEQLLYRGEGWHIWDWETMSRHQSVS